ncbi:hypothetical protein Pmani_001288 [Petrolisthes manimaculis]|uniref:Uncharacterized protein n=1 Tax=Petrolisthes manimaculis TaxID=1843537 RepID=A0AAE1QKB9_9EUCA|nr:hypothetical protein Pmani_001288 [Petrolisthes manimaculis]
MGDTNLGERVRGGEVAGKRLGSDSPEALVCGGSHELSEMETKITKPHHDTTSSSTGSPSPCGSFRFPGGTPTKSPAASPTKSLGTPAKSPVTPPSSPVVEGGPPRFSSSPVNVPTTNTSISMASHHSPSRSKTPTLSISSSPLAPSPSTTPVPSSPLSQNTPEAQKSPHHQRSEPGGKTSSPTGLSQNGRDPTRPPLPSSGDGVNSSQDSPLPNISEIQPRFAKFLENTNKSKYAVNKSRVPDI